MSSTTELPLFPLNTVLFPGGPLPLRIFEPRYVDMVRRCMREDRPFGVVAIRSGAEVGPVAETAQTGTTARIIDFQSLADGLLGLKCIGESKFRLLRRWQQTDRLNVGEVEYLPPEETVRVPRQFQHLGEVLRKVLAELGDLYTGVPKRFDDASWLGCRIAEILPLELGEKLELLELEDPVARLASVGARVQPRI